MAKLGFDIDGVLYSWDSAARDVFLNEDVPEPLNEIQRLKLAGQEEHYLSIPETVGERNWEWFWERANELRVFLRGRTIMPSMEVAARLSWEHEVYLLTSRPQRYAWQTYAWLSDWRGMQPRAVFHHANKVKMAGLLDLRVVVDDRIDQLQAYLLKTRGSLKGAFVYGVKRYSHETLTHPYYRFHWVNDLTELLADESRWAA
jgi:hypothetical protein